jgi:hypothetical protein
VLLVSARVKLCCVSICDDGKSGTIGPRTCQSIDRARRRGRD